ncbi:hypothetical protein [Psychroserpens ponticola]|uniref:TonB C-terminal domain-containing protein n=1 Tax=Psychroserpens ponticola TaxID=2932268 RepID=A0ABY7RWX0_9FLAO|nr:hypothetical protein [Psychroserpens ponticola]WCO01348.1 hypothetical protein MUN68_014930 [Psychroserpens ponticola]
MKRIFIFLLLINVMSCEFFEKKKVYSEELLENEMELFTWNDVDEYPTFSSCDSTIGKANKKQCFENTLRDILNTNLSQYHIVVLESIEDTVQLKITIDNKGEFSINSIESSTLTKQQIPQLDSLLRQSLDSLPKIFPAIKRSQQVTTQFSLPVIIKIE